MSTPASKLRFTRPVGRGSNVGIPLASRGGSLADVLLAQALRPNPIPTGATLLARLGEVLLTRQALQQEKRQGEGQQRELSGALSAAFADTQREGLTAKEQSAADEQLINVLTQINPELASQGIAAQAFAKPGPRQIRQDVRGVPRDVETGERIFPEVEVPETPPQSRRIIRGDKVVTQEFQNGKFVDIAKGPRFGRTPEDLLAQDLREKADATTNALGELSAGLRLITRTPGAAGLAGATVENFAGLLKSGVDILGGDGAATADAFSRFIAKADVTDVTNARTQVKSLTGRIVETVTGDTSGRFTDKEQAAARQVQGLNILGSDIQAKSALTTLMRVQLRSDLRRRLGAGQPPQFDLNTAADIDALGEFLLNAGMSDAAAEASLRELRAIQNGQLDPIFR